MDKGHPPTGKEPEYFRHLEKKRILLNSWISQVTVWWRDFLKFGFLELRENIMEAFITSAIYFLIKTSGKFRKIHL